jgi:hypothetical protein
MKQRVQRRPTVGGTDATQKPAGAATAAAANAAKSPGASLPHQDKIQAAFGGYDLSEVRAHVGPEAEQATETLGAAAFAFGNDIAFNGTPDLFTAAHEAAHVVMQAHGQAPDAEVGAADDRYETMADEVAERVVAGKSATDILDREVGAGTEGATKPSVQLRRLPEKQVSATAMSRLAHSRKAIDHTVGIMSAGRGNQYVDLQSSNFNSYFRMAAMRDPACWELDPALVPLARQYPDALTTAKAGLAKAGNCGEYAAVAMDFLRVNAGGEELHYSTKEGLDHAFVLMGDLKGDSDSDIVVADAWPTAPTACLWEDFFAYTPDRGQINPRRSLTGGGDDYASVIAAGLKLSAKGKAYVEHKYTDEETAKALKEGTEGEKNWIWRHENTADVEYDYVGPAAEEEVDTQIETDLEAVVDGPAEVPSPAAEVTSSTTEERPSEHAPTTTTSSPDQSGDSMFSRFITWLRSWL